MSLVIKLALADRQKELDNLSLAVLDIRVLECSRQRQRENITLTLCRELTLLTRSLSMLYKPFYRQIGAVD